MRAVEGHPELTAAFPWRLGVYAPARGSDGAPRDGEAEARASSSGVTVLEWIGDRLQLLGQAMARPLVASRMAHDSSSRFNVPAALAVSALGFVGGCNGDDGGDTGVDTTAATMPATAGDTGGATTGSTMPGTGGDTTGGDTTGDDTTGGDTGSGLPDCQAANTDQATCEAVTSCLYLPEYGGCVIDCEIVSDEATCNDQQGCAWLEGTCSFEPIA